MIHAVNDIADPAFKTGVLNRNAAVSEAEVAEAIKENIEGSARLTDDEWAHRYGRWFIQMRWIAVVVTVILIFLSTQTLGLLHASLWRPLGLLVLLLAACNVAYVLLLRRARAARLLLPQIYADLVILTALLHFSGGVENPLSLLMVFHVIIAGIMLPRGQCFTVAVIAAGLYAFLSVAEWGGILRHYTLLIFPHFHDHEGTTHAAHITPFVVSSIAVQSTILFLTAYFVTSLAERVRYDERQLAVMAERAMAERQLLEQALETTGTGLRVVSRQLLPYWINRRWQSWFTVDTSPASTTALRDDAPARQTLHDGQVHRLEVVLQEQAFDQRRPPSRTVLQITSAPLLDSEGKISQVVELAQDITQQKETQSQMMRAGKLAAIGELAGHVAHEVNNPIAIISAKVRLLLRNCRDQIPVQVAQELEKVTQQADRVAQIAQGLLSYCRPSTQVRVPLDLRLPIARALALVEQRATAARINLENRLPSDVPLVCANANEMEQVFFNLFLNAIDSMPQGGTLAVWAESLDARLEVCVQDTGMGIPPEVRERIFEPFFSTKEEGRGTGLGLAICAGLVRSHDGIIEVQSEVGVGSCFTVKLPALKESHG